VKKSLPTTKLLDRVTLNSLYSAILGRRHPVRPESTDDDLARQIVGMLFGLPLDALLGQKPDGIELIFLRTSQQHFCFKHCQRFPAVQIQSFSPATGTRCRKLRLKSRDPGNQPLTVGPQGRMRYFDGILRSPHKFTSTT